MTDEPVYEVLREVYEITEWRDGAVFKTRPLGIRWVDQGPAPEGFQHVALSDRQLADLGNPMTVRRKL